MGICPDALYSTLLEDLDYITTEQASGDVWPGITWKQYASHAMVKSILKKFVDRKSPLADSRAVDKFLDVNEKCSTWSLDLTNSWDEVLFGELKRSLYDFWYRDGYSLVTNHGQILDHGRVGPGAAIGAIGGDFYSKLFSSPMTCTSPVLYEMYSDYIKSQPLWFDAENLRTNRYGFESVVSGSRMTFAEKTVDISRLICVEPNLNMFFQLGFGHVLERRIKEVFNISLEDQPEFNRELARIGSLDGSFATIDLSSASDSLSLKMLEAVLPKPLLQWLKLLRSPITEINGSDVELHMVSTMGNGFTFPLQTMLFTCVVSASMRARGLNLVRNSRKRDHAKPGNFGVFGDDIICPTDVSSDVLRLLNILGFKVNEEKTFVNGPFRESCGYDFFEGHFVRGVYVKRLQTTQDRYALINRLNAWTSLTGICLPSTVRYILKYVPKQYVPLYENEDAGLRVPLAMVPQLRHDKDTGSILYRASRPRTVDCRITEAEIVSPKWSKKRDYNPHGLLLAFLHGSIRGSRISIRLRKPIYHAKWCLAPNWDLSHGGHLDIIQGGLYQAPTSNAMFALSTKLNFPTAVYFNTHLVS